MAAQPNTHAIFIKISVFMQQQIGLVKINDLFLSVFLGGSSEQLQ